MITIYGIKNCDTMKKAFTWLDTSGLDYTFHDYKKSGLDEATLRSWIQLIGWEPLVNKRGTTWKKLPAEDQQDLNEDKAVRLMLANLSLIKRPVVVSGKTVLCGLDTDAWQTALK